MIKLLKKIIFISVIFALSVSSVFAIKPVEAKINFLSVYGSSLTPVGNYGGILSLDWVDIFQTTGTNPSVTGADLYKSSFNFGIGYGQLKAGGLSTFIGAEFTKVKVKDNVRILFDNNSVGQYSLAGGVNLTHYDLVLDIDYHFNNIMKESFSPFVGLGLKGGLEVRSLKGFQSETDFKTALSFNFGADFKVWDKSNGRDFVALSFNNSYDFYGTSYRASYLSLGVALKFYSRP